MPNLPIPARSADVSLQGWTAPVLDRRAARGLIALERSTTLALARARSTELLRVSDVESDAIVATVKTQEVDRVAREAISGQAMLRHYSDTVARDDLLLADELRYFTDMARLGKGEILADLVTDYCRESRRNR
jgi:hypothetical protein